MEGLPVVAPDVTVNLGRCGCFNINSARPRYRIIAVSVERYGLYGACDKHEQCPWRSALGLLRRAGSPVDVADNVTFKELRYNGSLSGGCIDLRNGN
jgi:hypothetical protein